MSLAHHHEMRRKRGNTKNPDISKRSTFLDGGIYTLSILDLGVTSDQVRLIWVDHNVAGVSFSTWAFYAFSAAIWTWYGYVHKDKVIYLTSGMWVIMNGIIALGVFLFRVH